MSSFTSSLLEDVDITLRQSQLTTRQLQAAARVLLEAKSIKAHKTLKKLVVILEQVARRRNELLKERWVYKTYKSVRNGSGVEEPDKNDTAEDTARRDNLLKSSSELKSLSDGCCNAVDTAVNSLIRVCGIADKHLLRVTLEFPEASEYEDVRTHRENVSKADAKTIENIMNSENQYNKRSVQILDQVVKGLRYYETTYDFHGQIISDASSLLNDSADNADKDDKDNKYNETRDKDEYSLENFAYGSTPLSTWLVLMSEIQKSGYESNQNWGVLGSSCGWMVFYAALLFEKDAHGWEILPSLHEYASRVLVERVPEDVRSLVHLYSCDALKGDISICSAIIIAGQCWESWLLNAMYKKIMLECNVGTLLLDYNGALQRFMKGELHKSKGSGDSGSFGNRSFELVFVKSLPVSWGTVEFHLWVLQQQSSTINSVKEEGEKSV